MIRTVVTVLGAAATFPAFVLHEATHVAAGYPWLRVREVRRDSIVVGWHPDTPRWRLWLGKLAPTVVGTAVLTTVTLGVAAGMWTVRPPQSPAGAALATLAVLNAVQYAIPSRQDLQLPQEFQA